MRTNNENARGARVFYKVVCYLSVVIMLLVVSVATLLGSTHQMAGYKCRWVGQADRSWDRGLPKRDNCKQLTLSSCRYQEICAAFDAPDGYYCWNCVGSSAYCLCTCDYEMTFPVYLGIKDWEGDGKGGCTVGYANPQLPNGECFCWYNAIIGGQGTLHVCHL